MKCLKLILFMYFFACLSCQTHMEGDNIESYSFIGTWKLANVTVPFTPGPNPEFHDYSMYNIVYEFSPNGILTISGVPESIEFYRGHSNGEYFYSTIESEQTPNTGLFGCLSIASSTEMIENFKNIENFIDSYIISTNSLEINCSPLDGNIYFLTKTKTN